MFDWITGLIASGGTWGVALVMFLENVFPPIPSELIMPMAGYLAATGEMTLIGVILAGALGSVAGALFWYWIGLAMGEARFLAFIDRYGFWLTLTRSEAEQALDWFRRWGRWAVFLGRMVPAVRTLISVPAGLARMPLLPFILITTAGSLLWVTLLAMAGLLLEANYHQVAVWLDPGTTIVIGIVLAIYVYRVVRGLLRR
jgi:membrane protein DedA with SNARE-associated domain